MYSDLPSLNAMVALEAATRHRSFTVAAAELRVTQAAISRQIALLERELDIQLFIRRHRAVEPTQACLDLAQSLSASFTAIAKSIDAIRTSQYQERITIGATLAFSTLWLLPRIGEFRKRHPRAQIRVVSQDSRINLHGGDADLAIRYGMPPFDDGEVATFRSEEVFPVCSPEYAERLADPNFRFQDPDYSLIAHDVLDRTWDTWRDWFERVGIKPAICEPSLRFNHYTEALQAARAGHGITLGWSVLVKNQLEDGSLVRLGRAVWQAERQYNLVVPLRRKPHALRDALVEWLSDALSE